MSKKKKQKYESITHLIDTKIQTKNFFNEFKIDFKSTTKTFIKK